MPTLFGEDRGFRGLWEGVLRFIFLFFIFKILFSYYIHLYLYYILSESRDSACFRSMVWFLSMGTRCVVFVERASSCIRRLDEWLLIFPSR